VKKTEQPKGREHMTNQTQFELPPLSLIDPFRKLSGAICKGWILFLLPSLATGGLPGAMNYQGRLVRDGQLVNSNITATFTIYDGPTNTTALYQEDDAISVGDGLYSTTVGDNPKTAGVTYTNLTEALSAAGANAWMQLTIDGTNLSPREHIQAAPYALVAPSSSSSQPVGISTTYQVRDVVYTSAWRTVVVSNGLVVAISRTDETDDYVNFYTNYPIGTVPVGTKSGPGANAENTFGAFELSGNVLEWCLDWSSGYPPFGTNYVDSFEPEDKWRSLRGGDWSAPDWGTGCQFGRFGMPPETRDCWFGFRVVRETD